MPIEQAWNSHTRQVQSAAKSPSTSSGGVLGDAFDSAFLDAESSFSNEKTFQSKHPDRDNEFPQTPKSAVGWDGAGKYPDSQSLITMLNQQFPNQKFEALFLGQNRFGELGTKALADALKMNQTVRHLVLPNNQLSDFAVAALADMLKTNRFIGWLILNNNQIGNAGAAALGEALGVNAGDRALRQAQGPTVGSPDLKGLNAGGSDAELVEVPDTTIGVRHVILADNHIGDDGVIALATGLKHNTSVETLCLQGNPIGSDGVRALTRLCRETTTLKKLDIRDIADVEPAVFRELEDVVAAKGILLRS